MARDRDQQVPRFTARRRVTTVAVAVTSAASVAVAATGTVPAAAAPAPICVSSLHPLAAARMSANIATTLAQRPHSEVGFAASDPALGVTCALNPTAHFYAASVIKVTILSALLYKIGGVGQLTTAQRNLAYSMITRSSNGAATTLFDEVGMGAMRNFLNRAGMYDTVLSSAWGLTRITPQDELTQLRALSYPSLLGPYARAYVLSLMAQVISSQRWGVCAGVGPGLTVHIKNGWLAHPASTDWLINSLGVFTGNSISYQMAVLSAPAAGGQTATYGIQTVQDVAGIVNRNLAGLYAIFG